MNVTVKPGIARGELNAPPSKSYAHRLMICSALAEGNSVVRGLSKSRDMIATMDCAAALGAGFTLEEDTLYIKGCFPNFTPSTVFSCHESGSTLRFFIPIAAVCGRKAVFTGTERLIERGVSVYETLFAEKNISLVKDKESITIEGKLKPGVFSVPGNISSQFISGLLFALPLLDGDSEVYIIPPVESRPYIDITIDAIKSFGVSITEPEPNRFFISGGQKYSAKDETVEGDWSNAAALFALDAIGGEVKVKGLNEESFQGDKVCVSYLKKLDGKEPVLDLSNCPDLAPVLFAAAAAKHGALFTGTRRLRIKESDRAAAMAEELAKFGIRCDVEENSVKIYDSELKKPSEILNGHNDHRIVMAMTVLCSITGGTISDAQAISKSFPDFFDRMRELGLEVTDEIG